MPMTTPKEIAERIAADRGLNLTALEFYHEMQGIGYDVFPSIAYGVYFDMQKADPKNVVQRDPFKPKGKPPSSRPRFAHVIVEVQGGNVQNVYATPGAGVRVSILDWDNYEGEETNRDRQRYKRLEERTKYMKVVY